MPLIAGGGFAQIRILDTDGVWKAFGMCTGASYDEDYGVQPANCIGVVGPFSYASQNYSCRLSISAYVPERSLANTILPDGGEITLNEILPTRSQIQLTGEGKMFAGVQFYNKVTGQTFNEFKDVIISTNGSQIQPNSFVTNNIGLMAVERIK
ncbi:MAG: hypothetical protein WC516_06540 [Patescibacteria group bacterium]|jgi:hypothetical protein